MKFHLYKGTKAHVLSALTMNDVAMWGADVFVGVMLALFITQNIEAGSAVHVGLAFGLYRVLRAFAAIPIGRYLDSNKGHVDEYYTLFLSGLIVATGYFWLFFSTEIWQVYVGMVAVAVGHSLDITAWRILFFGNIPRLGEGKIMGVYETIMQITYGLAVVLAGFVGDYYGFEWVFLVGGVVAVSSSMILLSVNKLKF